MSSIVATKTRALFPRGQSMVELALCLPVVMIFSLGVADLGRGFYYREAVSNAARQGLRIAVLSTQQGAGDTACAGGGATASLSTTIPPASGNTLSTIGNDLALESTSTGAPGGTAISSATLTVTWHCQSNKALTNSTASSTDPGNAGSAAIRVQVAYPMPLLTPFLGNFMSNPVQVRADLLGRAQY